MATWIERISQLEANSGAISSVKKVSSFTLALTEVNKIVECESASPLVVTVPPVSSVAWPTDTLIELSGTGTGNVSVTPGAGVTIRVPGSQGLNLRSQWSSGSLRYRNTLATPLDTTNLVARWNADSLSGADNSAVTTWTDSVAGLVASETVDATKQPKLRTGINGIGGHQAVQFDGTSDRLTLSGAGLSLAQNKNTLAIFIAYQLPVSAVTGIRTAFGLSSGTNAAQGRVALSTHGASGFPQVGSRRLDTDASLSTAQGSVAITTNHAGILTGIWRWNVQDIFVYADGTLAASNLNSQTAGTTANTSSLSGAIGSAGTTTTELFSGSIAEILIFSDADTNKMANVHTYFANTYGVTTSDFIGTPNEWIFTGDTD